MENSFLTQDDLILLNNGQETHLSLASGTFSAIDLSFASNRILLDLEWRVDEDLCASDHFPIVVTLKKQQNPAVIQNTKGWKLEKANWDSFESLTKLGPEDKPIIDIDEAVNNFNNLI